MYLRPKTKRRVVVLLVVLAVAGVVMSALIVVQLRRIDSRRQAYRAAGMSAFDRGDYSAALTGLNKYLSNNVEDADAIYTYAVSLSRVPAPDRSNLTRAISVYRRYLDLRPLDLRARRQLLDLYARSGFASEGLSLADQLLQDDPNDTAALRAKVHLLEVQSQYAAALDAVQKLDALQPGDLSNQTETYRLMRLTRRPPAALVAHADAALQKNPHDPRCTLLRGIAAYFGDDRADARKWLESAAALPAPDAEFVRVLSNMFDRLGLYDRSLATLEKGADDRQTDASLLATLALRQWEDGRYDDAAKRLATASANGASQLLALRALVHFSQAEESADPATRPASTQPVDLTIARADLRSLETRAADDTAAAWAMLLHARFDRPAMPLNDRIVKYQSVLVRDPDNSVAPLYLGMDDRELGERDMAVQAWQQAARMSPGWATPHLLIARTLLDAGRIQEAAQAAQAAEDRAPDRLLVQTTLARAAYAQLPNDADAARLQPLLSFVSSIQHRVQFESETLPIYVSLMARTGHPQDAADVVRAALSTSPPPPGATLNALLRVDSEQKLGLKAEIESSRNRNVSLTPADGLTRAMAEADAGRPDDGLALLQDLSTAKGTDAIAWRIATLRYREHIADSTAARDWSLLGEDGPRDPAVLHAILSSKAAWTDRPLIDRTINRLRKLTGDGGVDWRLARARFELSAFDAVLPEQHAHATSAATMLADVARDAPTSAEAQLLWAQAREQLTDDRGALEHCQRAAELAPTDVQVSLALASLLNRQGKAADADRVLQQAAASPRLTGSQRIAVARAFAARGEYATAASLLGEPSQELEHDVLLAQIRQAQGDAPAASDLYNGLLKANATSEPFIRSAAWFFADHGQGDSAKAVLAQIDHSALPAAAREIVLGDFEDKFGAPAAARSHFLQAAKIDPGSTSAIVALIGFDLRRRSSSDVADDVRKSASPDKRTLADFAGWASSLHNVPATAGGDRLLDSISRHPSDEAARQTFNALERPAVLAEVAGRFPSYLPAQLLLAEANIRDGATGLAADVLSRAALIDPTDPAAPRASAELYRSTDQWDALVSAATEWRRRSMQDPLSADLALADGYLHSGNANAALQQLSPYIAFARSSPDSNQTVIRLYAGALCAAGRADEARTMLLPLLDRSAAWRGIWLQVAAEFCNTPELVKNWIEQVVPLAEASEQLAVAQAWAIAGHRLASNDFQNLARSVLLKLTAAPDATSPAWAALAGVSRELNDLPAAVTAYRRALSITPTDPVLSNDYAFAVLLTGGDLKLARGAAETAVTARPAQPSFQTTLGRIALATGDTTAAEAAFRKALHSDPNHRSAMIGLAEVYTQLHRVSEATAMVDRIDTLPVSAGSITADEQHRLDAVRGMLTAPASTLKGPT